MYKVFCLKPVSIAGNLIINGLGKGLELTGNSVLSLDIKSLDRNIVGKFKPDFAIGYDYAHFMTAEAEGLINNLNIPMIHYFADDPESNFSHTGDKELITKLADSDNIVFCWDRQYLSSFKNRCFYLPLGIDPDLYRINPDSAKIYDIIFAGRPLTTKRLAVLTRIIKDFPHNLAIFCYKKHFEMSIEEIKNNNLLSQKELEHYKNSYKGFLENEEQLAQVYSSSKIALNITMDQGLGSMNYRALEALSCGSFLLTDFKDGTASFFENEKDLVFYNNNDELVKEISKYLNNNELREKLSKNARNKIISEHTFSQRTLEITSKLKNILK